MNKAFYIISLALSVIFMVLCGYYIEEVSDARLSALLSSYNYSDPYSSYSSYYSSYDAGSDLTAEASLIAIFFFLLFITTDLLGVLKVKTTTTKVLGIIGMSLSGLMLLWDLLMASSPSSISFDEVGGVFILYSFVILAFSIVGLIQSIRYDKVLKTPSPVTNSDVLDS